MFVLMRLARFCESYAASPIDWRLPWNVNKAPIKPDKALGKMAAPRVESSSV